MISVLVVAAVMFLAMSIIMSHGMRHRSGGVLMEHHEVPPAVAIHRDPT
jgi:hypothetical protein